jgi:hypothetical protein
MGDFMNSNHFHKGGQTMLLSYKTLEILNFSVIETSKYLISS